MYLLHLLFVSFKYLKYLNDFYLLLCYGPLSLLSLGKSDYSCFVDLIQFSSNNVCCPSCELVRFVFSSNKGTVFLTDVFAKCSLMTPAERPGKYRDNRLD